MAARRARIPIFSHVRRFAFIATVCFFTLFLRLFMDAPFAFATVHKGVRRLFAKKAGVGTAGSGGKAAAANAAGERNRDRTKSKGSGAAGMSRVVSISAGLDDGEQFAYPPTVRRRPPDAP